MEEGYKPCPYCAEPIRAEAKYCKHCSRKLPQPTPVWRWVVLGTLGAAALSLFFYNLGRAPQADRQNQKLVEEMAKSRPAPEPTPPPQPKFFARNLLSGNFEVQAGQMLSWNFTVPGHTRDVNIAGAFHAFGGGGNDIQVVIVDPFNFENWKNGHPTNVFYSSGKVTNGRVALGGVEAGQYVIALDNRFSAFSRKQVSAQITISGYVLP